MTRRPSLNPAAAIIAGLGCIAALVSVFLPRVDSATYTLAGIQDNTLIENGDGWLVVGAVVLALLAGWAAMRRWWMRFALVVLGAGIVALAVYHGTDEGLLTLYPTDFSGQPDQSAEPIRADAGVGLYVAGVGGFLIAAGGAWLTRRPGFVGAVGSGDRLGELKTLTELRDSGTLSAQEFEVEKARILNRP